MKKIKFNYSWAIIFSIGTVITGFILLIVLLTASIMIKPASGTEIFSHFSSSFLIKAAAYNKSALLLSISERFIYWTAMIIMVVLFWKKNFMNTRIAIYRAAIIFLAFNIILSIIIFPFQYYRSFVLAHSFGLSNQSLSAWLIDVLKNSSISLFINSGIMILLYILILKFPKKWWIASAAVFVILIIFANFIYPVLIDPLFYKFTPLKDEVLLKEINNITDKAQIKVNEIMVADASKKTNTLNAYFSGIGRTKRIVIYDNLLNNYSRGEVLSVIAHEIGHWRYKHVFFNIIIGITETILLVIILKIVQKGLQVKISSKASNINSGFPAVNEQSMNFGVKLVLILFVLYSFLSYLVMPVDNFISRKFERQADKASVMLTGDSQTQIKILENLAVKNLSIVMPGKVLKYTIFSHPPIMERIDSSLNYDIKK